MLPLALSFLCGSLLNTKRNLTSIKPNLTVRIVFDMLCPSMKQDHHGVIKEEFRLILDIRHFIQFIIVVFTLCPKLVWDSPGL